MPICKIMKLELLSHTFSDSISLFIFIFLTIHFSFTREELKRIQQILPILTERITFLGTRLRTLLSVLFLFLFYHFLFNYYVLLNIIFLFLFLLALLYKMLQVLWNYSQSGYWRARCTFSFRRSTAFNRVFITHI